MEKTYLKKKDIIGLSILSIFIIGLVVLGRHFDFHNVLDWFKTGNIERFGVWAPLVFVLVYIVLIVSLIPSAPLNILAGAVFGPILGTLYSWVAVVLGGAISFILARVLGEGFVAKFVENESETLHKFNKKMGEDSLGVALLFRIIPFFPISGFNYVFGLSKMKLKNYLVGSILGTIPGVFILAYFGDSLSSLNVKKIIILVVMLLILGGVSWWYKKSAKKQTSV